MLPFPQNTDQAEKRCGVRGRLMKYRPSGNPYGNCSAIWFIQNRRYRTLAPVTFKQARSFTYITLGFPRF